LPEVLEPDVLTTGEVNLMARPVEERTEAVWNAAARTASIAFHFLVILLILLSPKIFPYHPPSDADIQRTITDLYIPSDLNRVAREPSAPRPKTPVVKIDPRLLRQIAPPRAVAPTAPCPSPRARPWRSRSRRPRQRRFHSPIRRRVLFSRPLRPRRPRRAWCSRTSRRGGSCSSPCRTR
jgi:hypothetical protein